jgi:putative transcriptional regulator
MSVIAHRSGHGRRLLAILAVIFGALAAGYASLDPGDKPGPPALAQPAGLAGQFLVATERLRDPRFVRTVVYMVRHTPAGAMGLIVNRPIAQVPLADLLKSLGVADKGITGKIRVYFGGPVDPERGFVLHTTDYVTAGTQPVRDRIALTMQPEILRAIGMGAGPRRSLFALGYAGWAAGQLEREMKAGAWVIVPADEGLLFDEHSEDKWERAMTRRMINL